VLDRVLTWLHTLGFRVLGFMDRMQVDVELRDIKQRRALQVQENERATQIAKYRKKTNKVRHTAVNIHVSAAALLLSLSHTALMDA